MKFGNRQLIFVLIFMTIIAVLFGVNQHYELESGVDTEIFSNYGGFIGGLLTVVSIWLAIEAYKSTQLSNELAKFENYYQSLNAETQNTAYKSKDGVDADYNFDYLNNGNGNVFNHLNLLINLFNSYLNLIASNDFISEEIKTEYMERIYLLYYTKVLWPPINKITTDYKTLMDDPERGHDDSRVILPLYAALGL